MNYNPVFSRVSYGSGGEKKDRGISSEELTSPRAMIFAFQIENSHAILLRFT